jgi:hypothetical protein
MPKAQKKDVVADNSTRARLNCYLTGADAAKLRELRKLIVSETGEVVSGNSLLVTALRALDLSEKARILKTHAEVQQEDRRRRAR